MAGKAALDKAAIGLPRVPFEKITYGGRGGDTKAYVMMAPAVFSIELNRDEVLGFLYQYQKESFDPDFRSRGKHNALVVQLDRVRVLGLGAALTLVAEYHRRILTGNASFRPTIYDEAWPASIRVLLEELGFYKLVNAKDRKGAFHGPMPLGLRFVPFISDKTVNADLAEKLVNDLCAAAGNAPQSMEAYHGLIEAITNVRQHAYLKEAERPSIVLKADRWWGAGAFDPENETLEFVIYDQGYGIPATLPKRPLWDAIKRLCSPELTDADLLEGAVEYGRTRTGLSERGNGLWTICRVVDPLPGSRVTIFSGRGELVYTGPTSPVVTHLYRNPFCGTLIKWSLKLPSQPSSAAA